MHLTGHQEKEQNYYDSIFDRGYNTCNYYPLYNEVLQMISQISSPHILEVGCGVGDLGKMIVEKGYPYRGFDFSEVAVKCSQQLCPQGNFSVGDAYNIQCYLPRNYNIVVALEVLEHINDLRMIENIPNGVALIASVPNYDDPAHLRLYQDPNKDIIERFKPYLKIVDIKSFASPDPLGKAIFLFRGIRYFPISGRDTLSTNDTEATPIFTPEAKRNPPSPCGRGKKYKKCCLLEKL
ncbi:MAG: methyltransferase [candidate division Zixibacteria bacterium]|nr:methyltransferase [candidate division Zixibacteria bacterium]